MALALAVIPLLLASFLGGYYSSINTTGAQQEADNIIRIIPIVRIYDRNGNLIYEKIGDPPTHNLAHLFFINIAPRYKTDNTEFKITLTMLDGTTAFGLNPDSLKGQPSASIDDHTLWVVAGTDTNPPSYNDNTVTLAGSAEAKVANYYFDTTTNEWILKVSGTITFSNTYNITSVGLAVDVAGSYNAINIDDPSATPNANVLIFRDFLPQSISVNNGDSISVQYEIHFKLP